MTHVTKGRKSSIFSGGFPIERSRTLDSLTRLMEFHQPHRCLFSSHSSGALLPRLCQAPVAPLLGPLKRHSSLSSEWNQRWLPFAKQPVRLTGQPLHTGPWALSCTRVSTPESPHQLPLPLWVGSPPSLSVPACLSAKSCNDTDLKGSWPNCFHPQAPRPLRVCLPPPPSPGLLQPVLGHHRPGLSH